MSDKLVLWECDGPVGIATINRPDKRNAISPALRLELQALLRRADEDDAVRVVVLRGAGKSFCSGFDISGGRPDRDAWRHDALKWHAYLKECLDFILTPWNMKKPVIACVRGHALGGGNELALACDFTFAGASAVFGEPEVRFSSVGPAILLPWIIGYKKARELTYFGGTVDAAQALALGMVNRVYADDELEPQTLAFARKLALISKEALAAAKLAINRGADAAGFQAAMQNGLDVVAPLYASRTEDREQFREIKEAQGVVAAIKWRTDQFKS